MLKAAFFQKILRYFFLLFIFLVCANCCYAQSKKNIKKNQVISKTEWKYIYDKGNETKYKSAYIMYDKQGNILEEITYNPDGTIIQKDAFKYNSDDDKTVEVRYNSDGSIQRKRIYKNYENGFWTERLTYDAKGNIIEKIKREYKYYE
ncbi:MAG: hypothetical protein ABII90_05920 [Bacteroidota bacterium]